MNRANNKGCIAAERSGASNYSINKSVEATTPRRCSFVPAMFHFAIVSGEAAIPGAAPHLGRWML
jgi:hypothetical protein